MVEYMSVGNSNMVQCAKCQLNHASGQNCGSCGRPSPAINPLRVNNEPYISPYDWANQPGAPLGHFNESPDNYTGQSWSSHAGTLGDSTNNTNGSCSAQNWNSPALNNESTDQALNIHLTYQLWGNQSAVPLGNSTNNTNGSFSAQNWNSPALNNESTDQALNNQLTYQLWDNYLAGPLGDSTNNVNQNTIQQFQGAILPSTFENGYHGNGSGSQGHLIPAPPGNEPATVGGESLDDRYTAQAPASGASSPTPAPNTGAASRRYPCTKCGVGTDFTTPQDLKRHLNTAKAHWKDDTPKYQCSCGKTEVPRKDNYIRHVENCRPHADNPYTCKCGEKSIDRHEHVKHVQVCGLIRQARKRHAQ